MAINIVTDMANSGTLFQGIDTAQTNVENALNSAAVAQGDTKALLELQRDMQVATIALSTASSVIKAVADAAKGIASKI